MLILKLIPCWKSLLSGILLWHMSFSQELFEPIKPVADKTLTGFTMKGITGIHSYFHCYRECDSDSLCKSINFHRAKGLCELNYASHLASYMVDVKGAEFLIVAGKTEDHASVIPVQKNCRALKKSFPSASSGNYWLDLDLSGPLNPFLGYCDMETDDGGWTLVWSFTFSSYARFTSSANYVKPVPKNMYGSTKVIQSDRPPHNETDYNALDFNVWKTIGQKFLVKSNINNWVSCKPDTGNLVTKEAGSLKCKFVKNIVLNSNCKYAPNKLKKGNNGVELRGGKEGNKMYYFEKSETNDWPTHDPCGENKAKQKTGVKNPHTCISSKAVQYYHLPVNSKFVLKVIPERKKEN